MTRAILLISHEESFDGRVNNAEELFFFKTPILERKSRDLPAVHWESSESNSKNGPPKGSSLNHLRVLHFRDFLRTSKTRTGG
jgi:hypothetical protein